jgi:hypothetical protein
MARLCHVRALNARSRVREQVRSRGTLERGGARSRGHEPSSEADLTRGGVSPRARRNPLEGGVSPRARRNPLKGALDWASLAGRGGHSSVGHAVCACLG